MADPYKQAAEKLDKETKAAQVAQQASFDKATEAVRTGKIPAPTENDMGPLPTKTSSKKFAKGGSASKRADGCCIKGKTNGRMV